MNPSGTANADGGIAPREKFDFCIVISISTKLVGCVAPTVVVVLFAGLDAGAGFFWNRPLTSLLLNALAAEPRTEAPIPLPAALAAALPAADPVAPAAELLILSRRSAAVEGIIPREGGSI